MSAGESSAHASLLMSKPIPDLAEEEFHLFQALVLRESGIHLGEKNRAMLVSRLWKRLRALELKSFSAYYRRVKADPQQHGPRSQPRQKARQGNTLRAARDPSGIGEDRTSHVAPPKLEANLVPQGLSPTPRSICNRAWAQSRAEPAAGTPGPNALPSQLDHSHWPSLQNEWHS